MNAFVTGCAYGRPFGRRLARLIIVALGAASAAIASAEGQAPPGAAALPFNCKVDVYRDKEGQVLVFSVQLEQPFLAEEFEKSNYLRLVPADDRAYLVYPKQTKFAQKHAAFYGRLREPGPGGRTADAPPDRAATASLRLIYETITENPDGTKRVHVQEGPLEVPIPSGETGSPQVYLDWAGQQAQHFLHLLSYYPNETFFEYCLLQSGDRYGITPPALPELLAGPTDSELGLYAAMTGALALQQALQKEALGKGPQPAAPSVHVSALHGPEIKSLDYKKLLAKQEQDGRNVRVSELSRFVPDDQYLLQFNTATAAAEGLDWAAQWGGNLLRLVSPQARDNHIRAKLEEQLLLRRDGLTELAEQGAIGELAVTGGDLFVIEGTDVTLLLRLIRPDAFDAAAGQWLDEGRRQRPDLIQREYNYQGHRILTRYTADRLVSSMAVRHGDVAVYSNSHKAIKRIIDAIDGRAPQLYDAPDYRYVSTLLPPSDDPGAAYFFASEAFLRRQVGPALKISERRRMQCFNHLVMLNNASMFYRLEMGRSPESLTELISGRFIDPARLVCPGGGTYAFDPERDTGTCSLHNRIKYLTPNSESEILTVTAGEQQEYERYRKRYEGFWQAVFDPVAVRAHFGRNVRLETCVLPFANSGLYAQQRQWVSEKPARLSAGAARGTVASLSATLSRSRVRSAFRDLPGVPDVLAADPTLTDLSWLGQRVGLNVSDARQILEIDPTMLKTLNLFGEVGLSTQMLAATLFSATSLPAYATIEVLDPEKARQFLELLTSKVLRRGERVWIFETEFDAYRLPDYNGVANYVLSYRLYALKARLHVALVGSEIIAATTLESLQRVIDAAAAPPAAAAPEAHLMLRLDLAALHELRDNLRLYWAERSRRACHDNIMPVYNLVTLYGTTPAEVDAVSQAKYGVTYYCPEGGTYTYDAASDQVQCTVHGNRQDSRQNIGLDPASSFARFVDELDQITARLTFRDDALFATVEIERRAADASTRRHLAPGATALPRQ